jgi:hypothetical protein
MDLRKESRGFGEIVRDSIITTFVSLVITAVWLYILPRASEVYKHMGPYAIMVGWILYILALVYLAGSKIWVVWSRKREVAEGIASGIAEATGFLCAWPLKSVWTNDGPRIELQLLTPKPEGILLKAPRISFQVHGCRPVKGLICDHTTILVSNTHRTISFTHPDLALSDIDKYLVKPGVQNFKFQFETDIEDEVLKTDGILEVESGNKGSVNDA